MRKNIITGFLTLGIISAAPPVMANIDPPWGFPKCDGGDIPKLSDAVRDADRGLLPKPYVFDHQIYSAIYLAIEATITPQAASLYPDLAFDQHRDWVVISRSDRRGKKEGERFTLKGTPQIATYPTRRISMRIDKCDGKISEMRFY